MKEYVTDLTRFDHLIATYAIPFAWKVAGAFAVWFIGGIVVRALRRLLELALERRHVDSTLVRYADSTLGLLLKALLFLMILSIFGFETTSFSAILAAAGVAIGVAWSGLLSNFAAGVFLILFRPFRVGDVIAAAGVTGVVREIGLFATQVDSGENLRIFVGNGKIFSDNILNYTTNSYRLVVWKIQISSQINPEQALAELKKPLESIPKINAGFGVTAEIVDINPWVTTLQFKVACHHADSSGATSEGYRRLHQTLREKNYPLPKAGEPRLTPA
ncbi:MAG: mechanosensitive ion channel family protein [Bdellovibrionales bacterium]|nr:mechanosensitive ion channel family protein [Bdellovibrionales bacterium]